jgi:hypothetical protein
LSNVKGDVDAPWAPWWLWLWGAVAVGLIVATFFVPFKWWAVAAAGGFGTMEGIGLIRAHDPYPPLTHVIHRYVPRWLAFSAIYGFTGAAGSVWLHLSRPGRLGALFALLGWFTTHFDVTFDQTKVNEERAKRRRLIGGAVRLFSRRSAPSTGATGTGP